MLKKALIVLTLLLIVGLSGLSIQQIVRTNRERDALDAEGTRVATDYGKFHVHEFGSGPPLVFLSGLGTTSPLYDFRPLWELLLEDYRIIIIERPGYGYNTSSSRDKTLQNTVEGYRAVLRETEIDGPFYLMAHSMGGLEAIHWASQAPDEIGGIVGLDITIPPLVDDHVEIPGVLGRNLQWFIGRLGLSRFMDETDMKEAVPLLDMQLYDEGAKERIEVLFHQNFFNRNIVREITTLKENAKMLSNQTLPSSVPVLLFLSEENLADAFEVENVYKEYFSTIHYFEKNILPTHHYVHHEEASAIITSYETFIENLED